MPRPVCVTCQREMRCNKNGRILEMISGGEPYQLWSGDEYKCPTCGLAVIARYGSNPIVEAFDWDGYQRYLNYELEHKNVVSIDV